MINELALMTGIDIPFEEGHLVIHQPTMKEISYIGEEAFFSGCQLLNFSKNMLDEKDKTSSEALTDFDILMSIVKDKTTASSKQVIYLNMTLAILFPLYEFDFSNGFITFMKINKEDNTIESGFINNDNFDEFKKKLNLILCLNQVIQEEPELTGEVAKRIAEKLKERHRKLAQMRGGDANEDKVAIFSRYMSILAVAERKNLNDLANYTIFQLNDEYKRWQLKDYADKYFQAKVAGASGMDEPDDWTQDIYSSEFKKNNQS